MLLKADGTELQFNPPHALQHKVCSIWP